MCDDDHLRDDPELPGGREYDGLEVDESTRERPRTPYMRELFRDPTEDWWSEQW